MRSERVCCDKRSSCGRRVRGACVVLPHGTELDVAEPSLDTEIERVQQAAERAEADLSELRRGHTPPHACCPSCALGSRYTVPLEKQERRVAWLRVLLTKRGRPEDLRRAEAIRLDAWP